MSTQFDWRSEEEKTWEGSAEDVPGGRLAKPRRRRWFIAGIAVLIILAVAVAAAWQTRLFVRETNQVLEQDVLAVHDLVLRAIKARDAELIASQLSEADSGWSEDQIRLTELGYQLDRPSMGLKWQPETSPIESEVVISPDLSRAEVASTHLYHIETGQGQLENVKLIHISHYKRSGQNRWMLAAPEVSFLGGRQSAQGRYITVSFPGIDEQPARRLAADLEGILAATCSRLAGINCPAAFHVIMTLVTEPGSIADIGSLEGGLVATNELLLPTPTLVGLPNDETGYRALLRAYGQRVVAATVATLVEYECCDNALFFRALLDLQMGQLGIRAWPVTQNQYRSALQGGFLQGQDSWGSDLTLDEWMDRPDWWQSYVLVEFLASISEESTVAAMQRRLSQELDFNTWLAHAISNDSFEDGVLRDAWTRFLLSKTAIG